MVEGDDGGVFRDGPVGQLLLDQLPVLVLVPRVCRFEAPLKVLQVRRNAKNKECLIKVTCKEIEKNSAKKY